jgi:hypothetical protein
MPMRNRSSPAWMAGPEVGCCAYLHAKVRCGFPVILATGCWGGLFGKARSGERRGEGYMSCGGGPWAIFWYWMPAICGAMIGCCAVAKLE